MIYIALTTQPLQAQAMLAAELHLTAYAPAQTLRRRLGRKDRDIRRPILPGYVFVDCHTDEDYDHVRATRLISGFLKRHLASGDTTPATIPYHALAPILEAADRGDYDIDETKGLAPLKPAGSVTRKSRHKDRKARRVNALALIGELIASATAAEAEMQEAA